MDVCYVMGQKLIRVDVRANYVVKNRKFAATKGQWTHHGCPMSTVFHAEIHILILVNQLEFNVNKCGVMHIGRRNFEFQCQMND